MPIPHRSTVRPNRMISVLEVSDLEVSDLEVSDLDDEVDGSRAVRNRFKRDRCVRILPSV